MNYNVNGIAFSKEDLETIALSEIKVNSISRSHLFYIPTNGKNAFLLIRAGDFIEQEFVDKYIAKGMQSVYELHVAEPSEIEIYDSILRDLDSAKNEKDRQRIGEVLSRKFGQDYWQETEKSFLTFALTCFDHYYFLDESAVDKMHKTSMTLYSRAIIGSAISVINCLIHRVVDPYFIKDLYNTVFIMDYGLLDADEFTYTLSIACENERNNPGSGMTYLENSKRSDNEKNIFKMHPKLSAEYIETQKEKFFNPEVVDIINYHHEKADGSGFPNGFSYSAMSDMETFLMFSDYMVPFGEHVFQKGDGLNVIKSAFEALSSNEEMNSVPVKKIMRKWNSVMDWAIIEKVESPVIDEVEVA
jgi:hypothetical protein